MPSLEGVGDVRTYFFRVPLVLEGTRRELGRQAGCAGVELGGVGRVGSRCLTAGRESGRAWRVLYCERSQAATTIIGCWQGHNLFLVCKKAT